MQSRCSWHSSFPSPFSFHPCKFLASAGMGRVAPRLWVLGTSHLRGEVFWRRSCPCQTSHLPELRTQMELCCTGIGARSPIFLSIFFPLGDNYKRDLILFNTEKQATKPFFFLYEIRGSLGWWTSIAWSLCFLSASLWYSLAYVGRKKRFFLLPWKMLFFLGPEAPLLSLASNNPSVHPYVKATLLS